MSALAQQQCTPCRGDATPLGAQEAEQYRQQTPEWELKDEAQRIERTFKFKNFAQALDFVNQVGEIAEGEQHHPDIVFGWGYVTVSLHTHKIHGLHENDFVMAAKIDQAYEG